MPTNRPSSADRPHPIAAAYVAAVNARDMDAFLAIFGPDATFHNRTGTFTGDDAIAGFARDVIFAGDGVLTTGDVLSDDRTVMAEVIVSRDGEEVGRALDVFRLDEDGQVTDLTIFYRTRHFLPE